MDPRWSGVDPNEVGGMTNLLNGNGKGKRGKSADVSYPILKSFFDAKIPLGKLNRDGMYQSLQSLDGCLKAYIKSHRLPIRIFQKGGELYAARSDLDEAGNVVHSVASFDSLL